MFEPDEDHEPDPLVVEEIYRRAPAGALTVAGIAVAVVFGIWFAFYVFIFLPRGMLH